MHRCFFVCISCSYFVCGLEMFTDQANCYCYVLFLSCRCFEGFNATVLAYGQVGGAIYSSHSDLPCHCRREFDY